jgi:hypothetical protein
MTAIQPAQRLTATPKKVEQVHDCSFTCSAVYVGAVTALHSRVRLIIGQTTAAQDSSEGSRLWVTATMPEELTWHKGAELHVQETMMVVYV